MYKAKIFGKEVMLSDKTFKKIIKKYDIVRATLPSSRKAVEDGSEDEGWSIKQKCPLCMEDFFSCEEMSCPFYKFHRNFLLGCAVVVGLILKKGWDDYELYDYGTPLKTVEATIDTEKIRRFLLSKFKKVSTKG